MFCQNISYVLLCLHDEPVMMIFPHNFCMVFYRLLSFPVGFFLANDTVFKFFLSVKYCSHMVSCENTFILLVVSNMTTGLFSYSFGFTGCSFAACVRRIRFVRTLFIPVSVLLFHLHQQISDIL